MTGTIKPGIYRHYRGKDYRVHSTGHQTDTGETMVIYEPLYDTGLNERFFVRPASVFIEEMEVDGQKIPRYQYLREADESGVDPMVVPASETISNEAAEPNGKMHSLIKLLSILQLTKEQPLTGYLAAGIKLYETATLAEHHYTTTLSTFFLLQKIRQAQGTIDERKVLLMVLFHDLGELFGGDISGPLNRKYPDLREYKNKIGDRAIDLLASYLDESARTEFKAIYQEYEDGQSDESLVGRVMDQMDHQLFLEHHNYSGKNSVRVPDYRAVFIENHVFTLVQRIADPKTRQVMEDFFLEFKNNFFRRGFEGLAVLME